MPESYRLEVAGLERILPVVRISPDLSIASFVMLGDTSLVEACAIALVNHPGFPAGRIDILACPEAKAIPLTHAMARLLDVDYVVIRKSEKAYMQDAVAIGAESITTDGEQQLVLDGMDAVRLNGKNTAIIDDVVSTGGSLAAVEVLLEKTGCNVIAKAAVLLEEAGHPGEGLCYLAKLPVFQA